jgi:hypothetical protein
MKIEIIVDSRYTRAYTSSTNKYCCSICFQGDSNELTFDSNKFYRNVTEK